MANEQSFIATCLAELQKPDERRSHDYIGLAGKAQTLINQFGAIDGALFANMNVGTAEEWAAYREKVAEILSQVNSDEKKKKEFLSRNADFNEKWERLQGKMQNRFRE
jgi:hypothetical protein